MAPPDDYIRRDTQWAIGATLLGQKDFGFEANQNGSKDIFDSRTLFLHVGETYIFFQFFFWWVKHVFTLKFLRFLEGPHGKSLISPICIQQQRPDQKSAKTTEVHVLLGHWYPTLQRWYLDVLALSYATRNSGRKIFWCDAKESSPR